MGKRLPKKQLLEEIHSERQQLMDLIASTPRRQLTKTGMNSAGWSAKDVLTHLLDWELRTVNWCLVGAHGETPETPGDGFKWNQLAELNQKIYVKHRRKSLSRVFDEFDLAHGATLKLIKSLNDEQLTTIGHFEWTGKSWTVSDYLRANTASHYKWGRTKIRKWLKKLKADS
ncbi:MAG: ClbS/DfsB family four-helix bundle protein [Mariniblastus sp.]